MYEASTTQLPDKTVVLPLFTPYTVRLLVCSPKMDDLNFLTPFARCANNRAAHDRAWALMSYATHHMIFESYGAEGKRKSRAGT